jgi:hypothetical protein
MNNVLITLIVFALSFGNSYAQPNATDFASGATNVNLDASTLAMSDFPFDNPAIITINNLPKLKDKNGKDVVIKYARMMVVEGLSLSFDRNNAMSDSAIIWNNSKGKPVRWERQGDAFYMIVLYNQVLYKPKDEKKSKTFYKNSQYFRSNTTYVIRVSFYDEKDVFVAGILRSNYTRTKIGDYLKTDFGFARVPNINGLVGFTSVHFHFAAINYDADLGKIKSFTKEVPMRLSLFFGISPLTIYSDTKVPVTKLSGAGNFIYGIGIRSPFYGWYGEHRIPRMLLQPMRLNIGNMVFTQANASPLILTPVYAQAWYFGLSYDFTLLGLFGPISKLVTPP